MLQVIEQLQQLHRHAQSVLLVLPKHGQAFQDEEDFACLHDLQKDSTVPVVAGFVIPPGSDGALIKAYAYQYGFPFAESYEGVLHNAGQTLKREETTSFASAPISAAPRVPLKGSYLVLTVCVLIAVLAAGLVLSNELLPSTRTIPAQSSIHSVQPSRGEAAFASSPHGFNDEMRIVLPLPPPLSSGRIYKAWLISDQKQSDAEWLQLGTLTKDSTDTLQLLYPGDAFHTDLLEEYSKLCITTSDVNALQPLRSDCRYYGEITQTPNANDLPEHFSLLDHVRHLLTSDPTLESLHIHNGLMTNFDAQVSKIAEWASATKTETSMPSIHRYMVRILDELDGFSLVHHDVPDNTPLLVDTTSTSVGVLHGSIQVPSYVVHIEKHVNGVLNSPGVSEEQKTLARQMYRDMQTINSELSQVYVDAKQLVMMNDARLMQATLLLEDLRSNASNAYSGGYQDALSPTRIDGTKDIAIEFEKFGIIQLYAV